MVLAVRCLFKRIPASPAPMLGAACCALLLSACAASPPPVASATLPDWSGAWSADADEVAPGARAPNSVLNAVRDSLGLPGSAVPLTPRYAALRAALVARPGGPPSGAVARCLPTGMPALMNHGAQIEFVFSAGRITLIFENGEVRRIYTDGRAHPDQSELYVNEEGHSIGHWEGSTLVVDTIGMHPQAELFLDNGINVTRNTHVVERINRVGDVIQIDTVVTDPEVFSEPYRYTRRYPRVGEADFVIGCKRNNRDSDEQIDLTPPPLEG